jgi:hypothetical protein
MKRKAIFKLDNDMALIFFRYAKNDYSFSLLNCDEKGKPEINSGYGFRGSAEEVLIELMN